MRADLPGGRRRSVKRRRCARKWRGALEGAPYSFGLDAAVKRVAAELRSLREGVAFCLCTRNEGLHLTIWCGRPLQGAARGTLSLVV